MQAVPSTSAQPSAATSTISNTAPVAKSSPKAVKAAAHSHPQPLAHAHCIGAAVSDSKREIEEISKKISEHADAIYHTWKSRGLAPTELLEFYTHAAAADASGAGDFFAVATDDTAEGLQKLVNTFVIKDKEQRAAVGVKAKSKSTSGEITEHSNMAGKLKQNATKPAAAQKTATAIASTKTTTSSAILLKPGEVGRDGIDAADTLKKKIAKTSAGTKATSSATATGASKATATATSSTRALAGGAKSNACVKVSEGAQQQQQQQQKQQQVQKPCAAASSSPSAGGEHVRYQPQKLEQAGGRAPSAVTTGIGTTTATTKPTATATKPRITALGKSKAHTAAGSPMTLDINLNLDVNDLSELQTHNLRKIKELLQENANTTAAPTAPESAKVKKLQTPVKLGDAKSGTAPAAAATAATTVVTNHSSRAGLAAKNNNGNSNVAARVPSGESGGSGDELAVPIGGAGIIGDKNSSGSRRSSGSVSGGSSSITNNNTSHSQSSVQLKRSGATKVSTKLAPDNQAQSPPQSQQQLPQQQQQLQSGGNIKAKDNEKIATRIASSQPTSNGSHKPIKIAPKEDNNNNNHSNNDNNNSSSNKAPTAKKETKAANIAGAVGGGGTENQMEVGRNSMPAAPTKFAKPGRTLVNGQDKNLGRPILTRGSVAERVLMFEKCPDMRNSFLNIKRPDPADAPPKSLLKVKLHATPPSPQEQNSLQKEFRSNKSVYIPRFYFPHGKPQPTIALERTLRGILGAFDSFPNNQVTKDELPRILKLCGLPFYWRMPVMIFCQQGNSGLVERQRFVEFWKQMNVYCHDAASRFVYILSRGQRFRSYILPEDMAPLVQDVVDTHPGLAFLKEATEFHSRYVHTVIARIFYSVNRSWSGKISISELKKSDLLEIISLLEEEDDINQIMAFFSYEHFYVIYCKFWELDKDHDLLINQEDLARHSDHALSTRIVERIFSGCVTRSDNKKDPDDEPKMSYTDFVWFLLSEEDKRTPTAIEYWFRCMDVDGDGVLSMYELEYFYEEQQHRMESIGIETLPFEDCLCQMLDMIKPAQRDCISLSDLKRCRMTHVFFDTFFNLEKYLDHEQRDPFASQRDEYASDWDRFAAQEYELLISEENE